MKLKESVAENEPQIVIERVRRSSVLKGGIGGSQMTNSQELGSESLNEKDAAINSINNQYTFSPNNYQRRPSVFQTETIRKMHSAVELNKKILEKSKDSALVLMNIPAPPKLPGTASYNCKIKKIFHHFLK
jgi:hypothetical protein